MDNPQAVYYRLHEMERVSVSEEGDAETWRCCECEQRYRVTWPDDRASLEKTIDDVRTVFARAESVNRMITSITAYHPYGLVVIHQGDSCAEQIDDRDPTDLSWLLRDVSFVNPD